MQTQDIAGQTFGQLTAIDRIGSSGGRALWLAECSCGVQIEVRSDKLLQGRKVDCGQHKAITEPRLCSIAGCERPHEGRGWCQRHYTRWRTHGDPLVVGRKGRKARTGCLVEDCENPHDALGYCAMHYRRLRANGSPHRPEPEPRTCSVEDCGKPYRAKGYCETHRQRVAKYGTTELPPKPAPPVCEVQGCERRGFNTQGHVFCTKHKARFHKHGSPFVLKAHPAYRGDAVSYEGMHNRLRDQLGAAKRQNCSECGEAARQWSYNHNCPDEKRGTRSNGGNAIWCPHIHHYSPRCYKCHDSFDRDKGKSQRGAYEGPTNLPA